MKRQSKTKIFLKFQVAAAKHIDDVEIEGENIVPVERFGLFSRFPFLTQRQQTLTHLIGHRHQFLVNCRVQNKDMIRVQNEDVFADEIKTCLGTK
jgi:hypothetical protein